MIHLRSSSARPSGVTGLALAAVLGLSTITAPLAQAAPSDYTLVERDAAKGVTADALPTTQIDGIAWDQEIVGNKVYVGGEFANARPAGAAPGTQLTPRANLLAYDLATGELDQNFTLDTNGRVNAIAKSPDGSRVYVGGSFTSVNGQNRYRIAAFDTATGKLVSSFAPAINASVMAITVTDTAVYVGGGFGSVNGNVRTRLAAFDPKTGALLGWAPSANRIVRALTTTPDGSRVIAGGLFSTINGASSPGTASLDAADGTLYSFRFNNYVRNGTDNTGIYSLTSDGTSIFATAFNYGEGLFEGVARLEPYTGEIVWLADCHGDSYDATAMDGAVYVASHEHNCENIGSFPQLGDDVFKRATAFAYEPSGTVRANRQRGYSNFGGMPATTQVNWFPELTPGNKSGMNQASWTVEAGQGYVVMGGEFPTANGKPQEGLVRFARPGIAPSKEGPVVGGAELKTTATPSGSIILLSWNSSYDRDNGPLTYSIYRRDNPTQPIDTIKATSYWWDTPRLSWSDDSLSEGQSATYWVVVTDADGNRVRGDNVTATAGRADPSAAYLARVMGDAPSHYWRLDEASGTTAKDVAGTNPLWLDRTAVRNQPGITEGNASTRFASTFYGSASYDYETAPNNYTTEAWIKTTSTRGGAIVNMGTSYDTYSSAYDRHIYMTNSGQLAMGLNSGGRRAVISPNRYNDGQWHHVASTLSSAGMKLYVDGKLVGSNLNHTTGQAMRGYWRVGGDTVTGLPSQPSSRWFQGQIDEVAVYPTALSEEQLRLHAAAGGVQMPNAAPSAAFDSTCTEATCAFDATASRDSDGRITSHQWDFGDGSTGTGQTASHTYASSGSYQVTLTVTDDKGATKAITKTVQVTVPAPAEPAPAEPAPVEPAPTEQPTAPAADGVVARDDFTGIRTRWGSATTGGAWSYTAGANSFSTVDGTGRMSLAAGATAIASLAEVQATDVTVQTSVSIDKTTTGGGVNVFLAGRRTAAGEYRAKLRLLSTGQANLAVSKVVAGKETVLKEIVAAENYTPGSVVTVELDITGQTVAAKAWTPTEAEPTTATVSVQDSTLQTAGSVGLVGYASGSATNAPYQLAFDDLVVTSKA
ncbi:hypothetical protein GCM10027030_18510 [Luteococcus sediminum]